MVATRLLDFSVALCTRKSLNETDSLPHPTPKGRRATRRPFGMRRHHNAERTGELNRELTTWSRLVSRVDMAQPRAVSEVALESRIMLTDSNLTWRLVELERARQRVALEHYLRATGNAERQRGGLRNWLRQQLVTREVLEYVAREWRQAPLLSSDERVNGADRQRLTAARG